MTPTTTPPPQRPATPTERKALALQRLDASRTLLIQRLYPQPDAAPAGSANTSLTSDVARLVASLIGRMERHGTARGVWRTARALARRWWTRQPWHHPVGMVAGTLAEEARPLVRRHPWACLAAAAALGGALVLARPWVARAVRHRTRDWHRHVGPVLWRQLAQVPVQLALAGALSAWLKDLGRRSSPPQEPHAPPPAGGQ
jgi:hypothetical protein